MITANKFMRANYGAKLRAFLTTRHRLEQLVDFGELRVFEEATTYPVIIISSQGQRDSASVVYAALDNLDFKSLQEVVKAEGTKMPEDTFSGMDWSLANRETQIILDKLRNNATRLEQYTKGKIFYGIKTGFNDAFFIDQSTRDQLIAEDRRSAEIIKPLVTGENVKRYDLTFEDRHLIFTRRGIDITQYKAIEKYLSQYRTQLEPRPSTWNTQTDGIWPGRKPGPY